MRPATRGIGLAFLFATLVALHYGVRPLLAWRISVDFLLIGVLLVSVRVRLGLAALVGACAGLVSDALSPSAFGAGATAMVLVAAGAAWLKAKFFAEQAALIGILLAVGKVAFDAIYLVAEQRLPVGEIATQLAGWSSLSALVTAAVGLAVLVVFRPFTEGPRVRV